MSFLAVICVNVTPKASLCMSCIKYYSSPQFWWEIGCHIPLSKIYLEALKLFPVLYFIGLAFMFSGYLFYISPASILISSWFVSISSGCSISLSSISFLHRHFWWWIPLGKFGMNFWWCCHLGNFNCLMGNNLNISILRWFTLLLHFQWCNHSSSLNMLTLYHRLHSGYCLLCLWLLYLGPTKKLDTPWSFMADYT